MKSTEELKKLKALNMDQLNKELAEQRKKLALVSLSVAVNKTTDYSEVGKLKKSIARIRTLMSQEGVING